jgi:branched-chain amino acid transport system substrate-binding protein
MTAHRILVLCVSLLMLASCAQRDQPPRMIPDQYYGANGAVITPETIAAEDAGLKPSFPKDAVSQGDVVIGMLVPLTGPHAQLGQQLRDAALMALYDKQKSLTRMEMTRNPQLIIRDTGSTPESVAKATQELIDKKAKVILGPLMSDDVKVASELTLKKNIPLITFSNNDQVGKAGVYLFGFDPAAQIGRVADYALKQQIVHYAALAPQSDYGRKVVRQLSDKISLKKQSLQPVEFFTDGKAPPALSMNRVLKTVKEWGDSRKAVFLPLTGKTLYETATTIMTHKKIGAPFIKLLGTGLWDDPQLMAIPALQGAWFATSNPTNAESFSKNFNQTYGYLPVRLASLGYDAVALVTTLALDEGNEAFTEKTLTDREGFVGPANGSFRLLPDGRVERALAIIEITSGKGRIIDPVPTRF